MHLICLHFPSLPTPIYFCLYSLRFNCCHYNQNESKKQKNRTIRTFFDRPCLPTCEGSINHPKKSTRVQNHLDYLRVGQTKNGERIPHAFLCGSKTGFYGWDGVSCEDNAASISGSFGLFCFSRLLCRKEGPTLIDNFGLLGAIGCKLRKTK